MPNDEPASLRGRRADFAAEPVTAGRLGSPGVPPDRGAAKALRQRQGLEWFVAFADGERIERGRDPRIPRQIGERYVIDLDDSDRGAVGAGFGSTGDGLGLGGGDRVGLHPVNRVLDHRPGAVEHRGGQGGRHFAERGAQAIEMVF